MKKRALKSDLAFPLIKISNQPTAEDIISIITLVTSMHKKYGETSEQIFTRYVSGECCALSDLINDTYGNSPELERILFSCSDWKHWSVRLKQVPDIFYDIHGPQTGDQMAIKLSQLWNTSADKITHGIYEEAVPYTTRTTKYCAKIIDSLNEK